MDTNLKYIQKTFLLTVFFVLLATQVFFALNAGLFFNPPLTGALIVWTHLHTMGVITPFFMGTGWYYLAERYGFRVSKLNIVIHFITLYGSLLPFLYFVSDRAGSVGLSVSAGALFASGVYYILVFGIGLYKYGRKAKENRTTEFWIDAASLYFLLQVVMFGFVLALNLSYGFLRRDEIHSLRLHSHSGIAGYWLLQLMLLSRRLFAKGNDLREEGKSSYLKVAAVLVFSGLFLWTSVHDRFPGFFYLFVVMTGLSLVYFALYAWTARNQFPKGGSEVSFAGEFFRSSSLYSLIALGVGIYMIMDTGDTLYERNIPLIYAFLIFYGIFALLPAVFSGGGNLRATTTLVWTYRLYLKSLILVVFAIYYERLVFLKVLLSTVLIIMLVFYFLLKEELRKQRA